MRKVNHVIATIFALFATACATSTSFEDLDSDKSGLVSQDEVGQQVDNFSRYDADGDGALNRQEYQQAYQATKARRELEASLLRSTAPGTGSYGR